MRYPTRGEVWLVDLGMLESLDPRPTPEVKAAWSREIERRVRQIDEGAVDLLEWQDVRAELFADE